MIVLVWCGLVQLSSATDVALAFIAPWLTVQHIVSCVSDMYGVILNLTKLTEGEIKSSFTHGSLKTCGIRWQPRLANWINSELSFCHYTVSSPSKLFTLAFCPPSATYCCVNSPWPLAIPLRIHSWNALFIPPPPHQSYCLHLAVKSCGVPSSWS